MSRALQRAQGSLSRGLRRRCPRGWVWQRHGSHPEGPYVPRERARCPRPRRGAVAALTGGGGARSSTPSPPGVGRGGSWPCPRLSAQRGVNLGAGLTLWYLQPGAGLREVCPSAPAPQPGTGQASRELGGGAWVRVLVESLPYPPRGALATILAPLGAQPKEHWTGRKPCTLGTRTPPPRPPQARPVPRAGGARTHFSADPGSAAMQPTRQGALWPSNSASVETGGMSQGPRPPLGSAGGQTACPRGGPKSQEPLCPCPPAPQPQPWRVSPAKAR